MTPEWLCLGLLDGYTWTREPGSLGQHKYANRLLEEKEIVRWVYGYGRVNELAEQLPETRLTYMADRKTYIYDLFVEAPCPESAADWPEARPTRPGAERWQDLATTPGRSDGAHRVHLRAACHPGCKARVVHQQIKAIRVTLPAPQRKPPPDTPPTLDQMVRRVAGLGGFHNRKSDGFPGPKILWIGLQRAADFVLAMAAQQGLGVRKRPGPLPSDDRTRHLLGAFALLKDLIGEKTDALFQAVETLLENTIGLPAPSRASMPPCILIYMFTRA